MGSKLLSKLMVEFGELQDPDAIRAFFKTLNPDEQISMFIGAWTIITALGTQGVAKGEEASSLGELVSWEISTIIVSMHLDKLLPFFDIFMSQVNEHIEDENMVIN